MLSPAQIEMAALGLDQAEKSLIQCPLISLAYPEMDMDDAYAIQDAWVRMKRAAGQRQIGWKIGLTSRAMQQALNIETPDSGVLFEDMLFENGASIPKGRFIQPRIEAELAFLFKQDLAGATVTAADVLAATAYVQPALEILDTRILRQDPKTGKMRSVFDTISDNAANAGLVLGGRMMPPDQLDMRWVGAIVSRDASVEETGLAAGVLNDPVQGIVWLARRLGRYGQSICAGDVVLAGSFIRPIETHAGATISADYGPLGTVACHFL